MPYTDKRLCECLKQLADTLGETPTATQCDNADVTPSSATYCRRFNSWNDALETAGLSINTEETTPFTDDELIAFLVEFADRIGQSPTQKQVQKASEMPSVGVYKNHFGDWNTALRTAGLDVNIEMFSDDELVAILQEFASELSYTPSKNKMDDKEELPSAALYRQRFGSWNQALRAAGLEPNYDFEEYDETDEELLQMLRDLAAKLNKSPTKEDTDIAPQLPSSGVFINRFRGWNAAKQAAGLSISDKRNQYSETELIHELRRISQTVETPLTQRHMNEADAPSSSTYVRRFDSWTAALEEAGLANNQETPTDF